MFFCLAVDNSDRKLDHKPFLHENEITLAKAKVHPTDTLVLLSKSSPPIIQHDNTT